jgi:hypothetical protein
MATKTKKATKKLAAPKKAAPKKAAPKKAAPKKAAPKKAVAAAPKKSAAKKKPVAAKAKPAAKAAPKKAAPKAKAAPKVVVKAKAVVSAKPAKAAPPAKAAAKTNGASKMKVAPKAKPAAKAPTNGKAKAPISRRDGAGHLDPKYAEDLMAMSNRSERRQPERAFFGGRVRDDLAESLGEQVIEQATTGEHDGEDVQDQEVEEERGGPFVPSTGAREYAHDIDASNPRGAEREPFPKT